jgi:hypothetical protein
VIDMPTEEDVRAMTDAGTPMQLCVQRGEEAPPTSGRRAYFDYFDHGVKDATGGFMRAERIRSKQGLGQPTGWHYHTCTVQFVYQLTGWLELVFEDGTICRLHPGDTALIPGGMRHNELRASDDFEILEVSVPAQMGTVGCEAPPAAAAALEAAGIAT